MHCECFTIGRNEYNLDTWTEIQQGSCDVEILILCKGLFSARSQRYIISQLPNKTPKQTN